MAISISDTPDFSFANITSFKCKKTSLVIVNLALTIFALVLLSPLLGTVYISRKVKYTVHRCAEGFRSKKKLCLVLQARGDYNGAFKKAPVAFDFGLKDYMKIVTKKISCVSEMDQVIKEQALTHQIKILWIRAHGDPKSLRLDDSTDFNQGTINTGNVYRLRKPLAMLHPQAVIVLESCEAGKELNNEPCIARKVSEMVSGRRIFASQAITCNECYHIVSIDPLKILIVSEKIFAEDSMGIFKKILKSLFANFAGINLFPWHVTQTYAEKPLFQT